MSAEQNKALSNRVALAISEGDLGTLDDLMVPELAEEFKRDIAEIRRAFPDHAGTNVEQIAEGEKVANRFVFLGTHLGEFEGVAPTGRRVEFVGQFIDRGSRARLWRAGSRWTGSALWSSSARFPSRDNPKTPAPFNLAPYYASASSRASRHSSMHTSHSGGTPSELR